MTNPTGSEAASPDAEIASRITNALIVKNINVRALSDETGISYPTLRRSLKGGRSFTFSEFGRIAESLGVPPSSLLPETMARGAA